MGAGSAFTDPPQQIRHHHSQIRLRFFFKLQHHQKQKPATTSNGGMQMAIRTFRHGDWQGGGEDNFDDEVTRFLEEIGLDNVVSVTPMTYTAKSENVTDYGVIIYYAQPRAAPAQPPAAESKTEPVAWRD